MKKTILLILFVVGISTIAQNKKSIKSKSDLKESIKADALKWFKDVYVEKTFKDPYSYKVLKSDIEVVSSEQAINDSISVLNSLIENVKISKNELNAKVRSKYEESYNENRTNRKKAEDELLTTSENQKKWIIKEIDIFDKYAPKYLDYMKEYDLYELNVNEKNRLQKRLSTLSNAEKTSISFYSVKIDAYSKNSLGNEVLGRFKFPFSVQGPIGINSGQNSVIQTNEE